MLVVGIFTDIRAIVADQVIEHRPHRLHVHVQRRHQRRPIRQPHAVGQPRLIERILRQRLGLLIADRLQQILQPPQEQVSGAQRPHLLGLQQPQFTHRLQRRQQRTPLQRRLAAAADQLEYRVMNSISRMPPAPSLMLSFRPRRRTSRAIMPFMLRSDWMTLKSI